MTKTALLIGGEPIENSTLAMIIATEADGGRGLAVFPCHETHYIDPSTGKDWIKSPIGEAVPNGFKNATKKPTIILDWWKRWPSALVGIADVLMLGIDLDRGHNDGQDGIAVFDRLAAGAGETIHPKTPAQDTPSGGRHYLTKLDPLPDGYKIPQKLGPGIDLKGYKMGYLCTGTLPDGKAYKWLPGRTYLNALQYPPEFVIAAIRAHNAPPPPRFAPRGTYSGNNDYKRARAAVLAINISRAQNYDEKVRIGMALTRLGESGLQLWHEFCSRDTRPGKYNPDEIDQHWKRIQKNRVTLGTLFYLASQDSPDWWKAG